LTLVHAAYVIGNLCALLFFGRLSDLIGRRRATLPGMAAAVVSAGLFLAADSTPWLIGGRIVSGFAIGIASGICTAFENYRIPRSA
jgi:MFS family permease